MPFPESSVRSAGREAPFARPDRHGHRHRCPRKPSRPRANRSGKRCTSGHRDRLPGCRGPSNPPRPGRRSVSCRSGRSRGCSNCERGCDRHSSCARPRGPTPVQNCRRDRDRGFRRRCRGRFGSPRAPGEPRGRGPEPQSPRYRRNCPKNPARPGNSSACPQAARWRQRALPAGLHIERMAHSSRDSGFRVRFRPHPAPALRRLQSGER